MSTSDTRRECNARPHHQKNHTNLEKASLVYLFASVFLALFGMIYESLSYDVYSVFMVYAFLFPLVGGAIPFALLAWKKVCGISRRAASCYHAGIATLAIGCIVQGVLEIYGTTNELIIAYWMVGCGLSVVGVGAAIFDIYPNRL